jgi:hypothetical protein
LVEVTNEWRWQAIGKWGKQSRQAQLGNSSLVKLVERRWMSSEAGVNEYDTAEVSVDGMMFAAGQCWTGFELTPPILAGGAE